MQKNLNIEKIIFKVVQIKFLAMHVNNKKISFDIFIVRNLLNIFMVHDLNTLMIFWLLQFFFFFHTHNVFLAVTTNIAVLLMTASVLQGHIYGNQTTT